MLGGGNPGRSSRPARSASAWAMLAQSGEFERVIGNRLRYSARGQAVHRVFGRTFRSEFGWKVDGNFALTNGSQNSFFYLFNLLCRPVRRNAPRNPSPACPEYIGYSSVGLEKDFFQANRPEITRLDNNLFKYQVDFDSLKINEQTGAVCFSRPTNPTGVVTDEEVERSCAEGRNAKASPSSSTMPTARPSPTSSTRTPSRFGTRT